MRNAECGTRNAKYALLGLALLFLAVAPARAETLEEVLSRMDAAAARFHGLTARLSYTKVTLIVNDRSTESGAIYFKKEPKGFKVLIEFTQPEFKTVLFRDNKGWIYRPKIAQMEEYDLGKNRESLEQFLLLGFGAPGHDLLKAYGVTLAGDTQVDGTPAVKLDLAPQGSMATHLRKVELWLARATWQPIQQQFTEPSGDHMTARYTDIKQNPLLPDSRFKIQTSGKVKKVRPQG